MSETLKMLEVSNFFDLIIHVKNDLHYFDERVRNNPDSFPAVQRKHDRKESDFFALLLENIHTLFERVSVIPVWKPDESLKPVVSKINGGSPSSSLLEETYRDILPVLSQGYESPKPLASFRLIALISIGLHLLSLDSTPQNERLYINAILHLLYDLNQGLERLGLS